MRLRPLLLVIAFALAVIAFVLAAGFASSHLSALLLLAAAVLAIIVAEFVP